MCALVANPNTSPRTIALTQHAGISDEFIASGIFSPGHFLKTDSADKVLKHATAGGDDVTIIATEAVLAGAGAAGGISGGTIDTAYAVGDNAYVRFPQVGERVFGYLKAGVSYAVGDRLCHAGDGTLMKVSAAASAGVVKKVVAQVVTALDLSATAAVSTRTTLRICG